MGKNHHVNSHTNKPTVDRRDDLISPLPDTPVPVANTSGGIRVSDPVTNDVSCTSLL